MSNERLGIVEERQSDRKRWPQAYNGPARKMPPSMVKPIAAGEALIASHARLLAENRELRKQLRAALVRAPSDALPEQVITYTEVMHAFVELYTESGGRIHGLPLTIDDLKSASRIRALAWPRHVCILLIRQLCVPRLSFPDIGKIFGGRDHTSAMHAVMHAAAHMERDPVLKIAHEKVLARFGSAQ